MTTYEVTAAFKKDPSETQPTTLNFYVEASNRNSAWLKAVTKLYQLLSSSDGTISTIIITTASST